MTPTRLTPTFLLLLAGLAGAAVDTATPSAAIGGRGTPAPAPRLHSWELPTITVNGAEPGTQRDSDLVGSYGQPRWSTIRQWAEVRSYVIPEGQFEFEYWLTLKEPTRKEKQDAADAGQPAPKPSVKQQYEAEIGLGHRLQLDLYQVFEKEGDDGQNKLDATKFELRYALADWDVIWGNPTLYGEWEQAAEGPDAYEFKLLTCGSVTPRLAWGNNLVYERKMGDDREVAHEFNTALSYSVIDGELSVGVENAIAYVTARKVDDATGDFISDRDSHWEISVGPSMRFYPIHPMHVIVTALVGLNEDAPETKTTMVAGWEF